MASVPTQHLTPAEYLAQERKAEFKSRLSLAEIYRRVDFSQAQEES